MNSDTIQNQLPVNTILNGNSIEKMRLIPANSIDFILTDPPYLVNYRDRNARSVENDTNAHWLRPAMREAYRVLKQDRVAIIPYGWPRVDAFFAARKMKAFVQWVISSFGRPILQRQAFLAISTSRHTCWLREDRLCQHDRSGFSRYAVHRQ